MIRGYLLVVALLLVLIVGMVLESSGDRPEPPEVGAVVYRGMWVDKEELDTIPMSGRGWDELKAVADSDWGTADLQDNDSNHDVNTLAGALVFARMHPDPAAEDYRTRVADAIASTPGTEEGGSANSALGRNLASYVIAADLIDFPAYDPEREAGWREWLDEVRTKPLVDEWTMIENHEQRISNHGTMHGASRVAVDIYLGDRDDLDDAWTIWKGYYGDAESYDDWLFDGDTSWFCDPAQQQGINPTGCNRDGVDLGGALPAEMQREGDFTTGCPPPGNYPWGALQSVSVATELLHRQGYPARSYQDEAVRRAYDFLWHLDQRCGDWWVVGDNEWQPALANYMFGADYPEFSEAGHGKIMGWTEWTHGNRESDS